jgi:hypothetical protein
LLYAVHASGNARVKEGGRMNKWRPNRWFGVPAHACSGDGCRTCDMYRYYEDGADTMLETLVNENFVIHTVMIPANGVITIPIVHEMGKGTLVFIPDDEVE